VETFSGALRFYLDKAGLSALLYAPKILCCVLFVLQLPHLKTGRGVWLCLLALVLYCALGMLHGASLSNIGFSIFGICPVLFGMVCSEYLMMRKRLVLGAVAFCLVASLVGLALDKYTSVPWKGYSYSLGDTELTANTAWAMDEADRLAGFARVSNVLSLNLAVCALFVIPFMRSKLLSIALSAVTVVAIVMTTSKAPTVAFVGALGVLMLLRFHWTARVVMTVAVLIGMLLPLVAFFFEFQAGMITTGTLSSMYDRLINSWPNMAGAMISQGWEITGAGLGAYGSTLALFPIAGVESLGSDSTVLYLWGVFGVFGIFLFALQIPLFVALGNDISKAGEALLGVCFCCLLTGWTTDMPEIATANLFLGMAIGHVLGRRIVARPIRSIPREPLQLFPTPSHLM